MARCASALRAQKDDWRPLVGRGVDWRQASRQCRVVVRCCCFAADLVWAIASMPSPSAEQDGTDCRIGWMCLDSGALRRRTARRCPHRTVFWNGLCWPSNGALLPRHSHGPRCVAAPGTTVAAGATCGRSARSARREFYHLSTVGGRLGCGGQPLPGVEVLDDAYDPRHRRHWKLWGGQQNAAADYCDRLLSLLLTSGPTGGVHLRPFTRSSCVEKLAAAGWLCTPRPCTI